MININFFSSSVTDIQLNYTLFAIILKDSLKFKLKLKNAHLVNIPYIMPFVPFGIIQSIILGLSFEGKPKASHVSPNLDSYLNKGNISHV